MNTFTSVVFKSGLAIALCISIVIYPQLRVSAANGAPVADLKSESQFRTDAGRFDSAIRAIAGVATMKLETPNDLKNALDIVKREHPNLKFHFSKLVVMALSDSTLLSALRKKVTDNESGEAFVRVLNADPKAVLKLDGATSLASRIQRSREADAATLRRAAEKLKEAAERIRNTRGAMYSPRSEPTVGFNLIRATFRSDNESSISTGAPRVSNLEPVSTVIASILIAVFVAAVLYPLAFAILLPIVKLVSIENPEEFADCQANKDERLSQCVAEANNLPSGFPFFQREVATALCYAERLQGEATCLLTF